MIDPETMSATRRQLCRSAATGWPYESRLPGMDLPSILHTTATGHLRRMVQFTLAGQGKLWVWLRRN